MLLRIGLHVYAYVPDLVDVLEGLLASTLVFLALSLIVGNVDARIGKEGLDPSEEGGGGSFGYEAIGPLTSLSLLLLLLFKYESSELACSEWSLDAVMCVLQPYPMGNDITG